MVLFSSLFDTANYIGVVIGIKLNFKLIVLVRTRKAVYTSKNVIGNIHVFFVWERGGTLPWIPDTLRYVGFIPT